ncbi:MAG: type I DNA topoisomerase [Ruminococcaceae bacterium]|nr:type I DNA topoisomerase [Oscillospiraceae bacterium]
MSKLVIVESPGKIKSIKKYLGAGYEVMASVGHVRDLPKSRLGIDVEHGFAPQYINMSDKKELIKSLKAAAAESEMVYLATDPDREGEAISWHLAQLLSLDMNEDNRVAFNEITESGVKAGMSKPRKINLDLVDAQQARRVLDRLVGYKISPFLWKKVKSGLSAGRVQSVALRLIVDREKEIEAFNPQEYWTIDAKLQSGRRSFASYLYGTSAGEKLEITCATDAERIVSELDGAEYVVDSVKTGIRNKQPAPPFTTSTMQQEASRKLGFGGQRTMKVAQQLYEGAEIPGMGVTGLITYMRTDSLRISEEARAATNKYIVSRFGEKYLPKKARYFKTKAGAQDAHEAIRPTNVNLDPEMIKGSLTTEQYKLYKLIWERFVASLMSACVQDTVAVDILAGNYMFKASGYSIKFDGYTVLYEEGKDEKDEEMNVLPPMNKGDVLKLKSLEPNQHFTQPPQRYTEPTLIKALEENGIGRPSTYAPIIANISNREYIEREKKSLKPTALGTVVTELMKNHFKKIVDIKFTAGMETNLDKIEIGSLNWTDVLSDFYGDFETVLKKAEQSMDGVRVKVPAVETEVICEKCGRKMVVKNSRFGKFLACPGYPECKNTKPMPEDEIKQPCPKCGAKLVKRVKRGTNKAFYGCSNYPACDFAAPGIPTGDVCSECGGYILKGFKGRKYCMNADCPSRKKK